MSIYRSACRTYRNLLRALQTSSRHQSIIRVPATTITPVLCRTPNNDRTLTTTTTPQTGFSYPGPRKLDQIVKLQLLNKHNTSTVKQIWQDYHRDHKSAIADVLSPEQYSLLTARTHRCRNFVLPVPRESGYFTLLLQFQGKQCFLTYLEDFKTNAAAAQPWLTVTLFDEMLNTKSLVLLRAEVTNMLTGPEAKVLVELIKNFYLGQGKTYDTVVAFNEDSQNFDFNTVLRAAGIAS